MKTKAWAILLRHLLFLMIFLEIASGISLYIKAKACNDVFTTNKIIPVRMSIDRRVFFITSDFIFKTYGAYGILGVFTGVYAFFGVIYLNDCELINFTAGIGMALISFFKLTGAWGLTFLSNSFSIIEKTVVDLFKTSTGYFWLFNNTFEVDVQAVYSVPFTDGWSYESDGTYENHMEIDYMQINLKCCGLTGRDFYKMHIPRTCCSEKYRGYKCVLDVAYSKGCLADYYDFIETVTSLKSEMLIFGFISFFTAVDCMYLAYLKFINPDGDYRSNYSSDEDEFDEY